MALIKWRGKEWDPFRELLDLEREFSRILDTSFELLPEKVSKEGTWLPSLDVSEDKESISVKVDLPGVKQEDIDVSIHGNILTIKGERKKEAESKDKNYHRVERFFGSFVRSLTLPQYADTNKVKASYKDGVLEITIPKTEEAKPKQIKVEVK
ncbi:MAG: Hsp20/alpha crystallin family protein [Candidatus Omnitrophica bacterium]|nr:Hsp20/alpha crystallin family protein [Candidatus Omnitrophota bacterium]